MLPYLKTKINKEEITVKAFGGLNVSEKARMGDLCYEENLTSDDYPSLKIVKGKKLVYETDRIINGFSCNEGWICTSYSQDGSAIFLTYDGTDYDFTEFSSSNDFTADRKLASLADCILIIPDNVLFFTKTRSFVKICVSQNYNASTVKEKLFCEDSDSNMFSSQSVGYLAKLEHNRLSSVYKIINTSSSSHEFHYIAFEQSLKAGDIITIKGEAYSKSDNDYPEFYDYRKKLKAGLTLKIKSITPITHSTPNGTVTETTEIFFDDHAIDTQGFSSIYFTHLTVERGMPKLENICSYANRIWATSGIEIFTSKLSDASEWNDFSTDAYGTLPNACFNATAETEGNFTAIVPFGHYIYAFKENSIHKIFGDEPDEYTLHSTRTTGVGKGLSATVDSFGDALFYASSDGIYVYRDNFPGLISVATGGIKNPISGTCANSKYYLLAGDEHAKIIYTYDISKNIWHIQKAERESRFLCEYANTVYEAGNGKVYALEDPESEGITKWKFGMRIDDRLFGKKAHEQLLLRYILEKDASFTVRAIYDDGTKGELCAFFHDEEKSGEGQVFLKHKRCSAFTLEFSGRGMFTLKTLKLIFYRGSEL